MRYPLTVPGMEGHVIEVTTATLTRPPMLLIDDLPAPPGQEKGEYLVFRPDGTQTVIKLTGHLLDIVPKVSVGGRSLTLTEPLQWYEWLLIALPLPLVFLGLAGAFFGVAAAIGNLFIFRSRADAVLRCLGAFGLAFAAFAVVLAVTLVLRAEEPDTPGAPPHRGFHVRPLFRRPRPVPPVLSQAAPAGTAGNSAP